MDPGAIGERLRDVEARIEAARGRSSDHQEVQLVAVSKMIPGPSLLAAYGAGQRVFGENRVQEATAKIDVLRNEMPGARWHLIGHLQTNKARLAAACFSVIESIDSVRLARKIDDEVARLEKRLPVLLEVNIGEEPQKSGFAAAEVLQAADEILGMEALDLQGLMTVAPHVPDAEEVRWVFRSLRNLRDELTRDERYAGVRHLSMGMSNDFEVAVEEGATIVRVGRALFGERPALEQKDL